MMLPVASRGALKWRSVKVGSTIVAILFSIMILRLPEEWRRKEIAEGFVEDLKSYTYVDEEDNLQPVVCGVCDGIPDQPHWAEWTSTLELKELCEISWMEKKNYGMYPAPLLDCYTADHHQLRHLLLSPDTKIDRENDEALVCKCCISALRKNREKARGIVKRPPKQAIANGYVIGKAPPELECLNEVELALVSRVRIHSQTWVFFAGSHKQIKGWHTFFRNRNRENAASLQLLQDCGMTGHMLVILSGPFTSNQVAAVQKATTVDPKKVIRAHEWLVANNYHYKGDTPLTEKDIPIPYVVEDQW